MALKLNTAEVDMGTERWTWSEDADVQVVGVPLTPTMEREALESAGVTVSKDGQIPVAKIFRLKVERARACFRDWEGFEGQNGKAWPCDRRHIESAAANPASSEVIDDALSFFSDLYEKRSAARAEAEGN